MESKNRSNFWEHVCHMITFDAPLAAEAIRIAMEDPEALAALETVFSFWLEGPGNTRASLIAHLEQYFNLEQR